MSVYEQRLRAVLDVVLRYLPPNGLNAHEALSEIIKLVDPWPAEEPKRQPPHDDFPDDYEV